MKTNLKTTDIKKFPTKMYKKIGLVGRNKLVKIVYMNEIV